jgi:septal ring factor EnvC (AmiA/AmiB activator)
MCPLLRIGGIIVVSLFAGTLSAGGVWAFRPPAFSVGRLAAARGKTTTVLAYLENDDAKEDRASVLEKLKETEKKLKETEKNLKESEKEFITFQFETTNAKIDNLAKEVVKIDAKIDKIQMGLIAVACLTLAQMVPAILTVLK